MQNKEILHKININNRIRHLISYSFNNNYERVDLYIGLNREKINSIVEKVLETINNNETIELWSYSGNKKTYYEKTEYKYDDKEYFQDALQSDIIIEYLEELGFPTIFTINKNG
jgi:hypothetical protein